jgi:hypothetical protein
VTSASEQRRRVRVRRERSNGVRAKKRVAGKGAAPAPTSIAGPAVDTARTTFEERALRLVDGAVFLLAAGTVADYGRNGFGIAPNGGLYIHPPSAQHLRCLAIASVYLLLRMATVYFRPMDADAV